LFGGEKLVKLQKNPKSKQKLQKIAGKIIKIRGLKKQAKFEQKFPCNFKKNYFF